MMLRNSLALAAAATLAVSPVAAQEAPTRASQPADNATEMNGGPSVILLVLALAAIIAGIVIAAGGGDDNAVSA